MIKLSPSILSANFVRLEEELKILEKEGIQYVHIDVMDGMFVPNISIGMPVIKSIRKATNMVLDAHFMIEKPERYIDEFISLGCDIINFHFEATNEHMEIIKKIKDANKKVGMTIKPNTSYKELLPYIKYLDLVLVMSVEPGFGGQKFMENSLEKISALRDYIYENNLNCELEVDGGIKIDNVDKVLEAGANVIVVGSDIFEKEDKSSIIKEYNEIFKKFG
ncbi:ribulose-phosphate 3-epimerase [uncultured Tyzzerella sp.]|uniref:ribulose-phosphate 3-epimerase n=1 Tax=uncultured Tyzzerella sp. TaxID=2321398 RepID=UPI0029422C54|nr:ribulose-phosphate 3-epimerase [uncultured Tyzzerella sp.]